MSYYIFKEYKSLVRRFENDSDNRPHLKEIDYLNYRLFYYVAVTQKMTENAFQLELSREFFLSTSSILEAYKYLKSKGFYDDMYNLAITCNAK